MLSFDDFVKVFNAYGKYVSQAPAPTPTPAPAPTPTPAPAPTPTPAPAPTPAPQDSITQMLTQMQAQLNQMQTPAPSIDGNKSLSVDDVIAKIFD